MNAPLPAAPEPDERFEDQLDELVAEFSDALAAGRAPRKQAFLERVPAAARAGLERCLKMIEAGMAGAPTSTHLLAPGVVLGRYKLVREIGRGGMALVWLAQDTELRRAVALKILRPGLALERAHVDRFKREALAIARLEHAGIVRIHDVGSDRGFHYLAMEYVEGPSLARVLEALGPAAARRFSAEELAHAAALPALAARGRTLEQALAALLQPVAEALATAHEHGVVHRDVKPSNLLLRKDGTAVVVDFGLAKSDGDPALSITGDTLGTPYYMSPEQAWLAGVQVDHRTDIYSLGVCFYEALTGVRPFEGGNVLEVFEKIKSSLPPSARALEPRLSRDGAALLRKAMARDAAQRYPNARALAEDLAALANGLPTAARQAEGGALRRAWSGFRAYSSGLPYEYRSHRTLLGWPLVHVINGARVRGMPKRVARGWLACSPDVAIGAIAMAERAYGGIAMGGFSFGVIFSFGGMALGLLTAVGGMAGALFSFGGIALGYLSFGGCSFGYGAIGGYSVGYYAMGASAHGAHVITEGRKDMSPSEFYGHVLGGDLPWMRVIDRRDDHGAEK